MVGEYNYEKLMESNREDSNLQPPQPSAEALCPLELLFVRPLRNWSVSQRLSTFDAPKTIFSTLKQNHNKLKP